MQCEPPALDVETRDGLAAVLAPRQRMRPSEWAVEYRWLQEGTSARPGRWQSDPWQDAAMNAVVDFPKKRGLIWMKATQIGGTEAMMNVAGWAVEQKPGPILFLCNRETDAREFALDRFAYMVATSPLAARFPRGKDEHQTILAHRYDGGKVSFQGSQTAAAVKSQPYRFVFLDEVDELPYFKGQGSAFELAMKRLASYHGLGWLFAWSTPTTEKQGIAALYESRSDKRRFLIPCWHCNWEQWLKWTQVRIDGRDADTARYECEQCNAEITNAQRAEAVWHGHYESTLPAEEAERREFVGLHISRLYDPEITIEELAAEWLSCTTEAQLQPFFNTVLGEPYTPSVSSVTEDTLTQRASRTPQMPAPEETRFLTAGIDVQKGIRCPVVVNAWTRGSVRHLMHFGMVRGWEALQDFLRKYRTQTEDGRELGITRAAIDSGYEATQVYTFCLHMGPDLVLPTKYMETGHDNWRPRKLQTLPGVTLYQLHRTYWMDRAVGRFGEQGDEQASVVLPVDISDEYRAHVQAARRVSSVDNYGREVAKWAKPEGARDDYLQAEVNAEFAAHMSGLDRIEELSEKVREERRRRWEAHLKRQKEQPRPPVNREYRKRRGTWMRKRRK